MFPSIIGGRQFSEEGQVRATRAVGTAEFRNRFRSVQLLNLHVQVAFGHFCQWINLNRFDCKRFLSGQIINMPVQTLVRFEMPGNPLQQIFARASGIYVSARGEINYSKRSDSNCGRPVEPQEENIEAGICFKDRNFLR